MSTKIDTGGPAFPGDHPLIDDCGDGLVKPQRGLTFLDLCAMMAMQGIISSKKELIIDFEGLSEHCYEIAKAMLQRKRELENGVQE